jgi:hypothetical protein
MLRLIVFPFPKGPQIWADILRLLSDMVKLSLLAAPEKGAGEDGIYPDAVLIKHRLPFDFRNSRPGAVKALRLSLNTSGDFLDRGGHQPCQRRKRPIEQRLISA